MYQSDLLLLRSYIHNAALLYIAIGLIGRGLNIFYIREFPDSDSFSTVIALKTSSIQIAPLHL